jgi:hypothetical protein
MREARDVRLYLRCTPEFSIQCLNIFLLPERYLSSVHSRLLCLLHVWQVTVLGCRGSTSKGLWVTIHLGDIALCVI